MLAPHVARLGALLAPYGISAVCGPLVGGAFLAQAVAASLDVAFTWTSWPGYALATPVDGRVAIVDDAINAGSAVRATASALTAAGASVVAVGALLLLSHGIETTFDVPVEHLATLPTALWPAADCPRCAAGAPLDDPAS